MPVSSVSTTRRLRSARISAAASVLWTMPPVSCTDSSMAIIVITAISAMTTNTSRHVMRSTARALSGTPTTVAIGRPTMTAETARARRSNGTRLAPTTAATPKYAPCGRPAMNREASSTSKVGANAVSRFAPAKKAMKAISSRLRENRVVATVSSGAPTTTPTA